MFGYLKAYLSFAWKKSITYKANLISWALADIGMYLSTIIVYILLGTTTLFFTDYSGNQILLYISNGFLINNIFSIVFSEAIDYISFDIWNGKMYYSILKPRNLIFYYIIKNINLKSAFLTPLLILFNIYCMNLNNISFNPLVFLTIMIGSYSMGIIFLILTCFDFLGLRSEAFNPIMVEILELRDKPDKIFNNFIRNIFIYLLPIYLTSAIPTRILINECSLTELIYFVIFPIIGTAICFMCIRNSIKYYTFGTEDN